MEFINNENSSDLTIVLNNKLWFRGKNQKQRAISERQKLYGNKGIVISKNESKSNKQMSSVFENPYELYHYTKQTPPHLRCFYEIIEHNSKLYFDIEYDNYCLLLTEVLQHLYSILKLLYNISPKNALYSQHIDIIKNLGISFSQNILLVQNNVKNLVNTYKLQPNLM